MFLEHTQAAVLLLGAPARKPFVDLSAGAGQEPSALACAGTRALSLRDTQILERMGYTDPFRVNTLFTPDGGAYDHTAALHGVAKLVEARLTRSNNGELWDARGLLRAWKWWALRDGLVGLPFEHTHRFLPRTYWPNGCAGVPEELAGIPVLTLPGRSASAHARLAAQGRLLDDLALALAQDAPNTRVVATQWLA